jgi:hypothetical protein
MPPLRSFRVNEPITLRGLDGPEFDFRLECLASGIFRNAREIFPFALRSSPHTDWAGIDAICGKGPPYGFPALGLSPVG